ncbi:MAG TPA: IS630 family transposase, partial [Candidatus Micrarchaeia archaeon]|nr:IS630 family transposase [Candidatus Micrarchaeia archaeon]
VADLIAAIHEYLDAYNDEPQPFVWTASVNDILAKVGRGKAILATLH